MEQNKQRVGFVAAITHGLKPLLTASIASAFLIHCNNIDDFSLYSSEVAGEALPRRYKQTISRHDKESADHAEV